MRRDFIEIALGLLAGAIVGGVITAAGLALARFLAG